MRVKKLTIGCCRTSESFYWLQSRALNEQLQLQTSYSKMNFDGLRLADPSSSKSGMVCIGMPAGFEVGIGGR